MPTYSVTLSTVMQMEGLFSTVRDHLFKFWAKGIILCKDEQY